MFEFDFTEDKLADILKRNKRIPEWFQALSDELPNFEITTAQRVAAFLAQCGHESADFTIVKENLNYSADGLLKIFPKYFDKNTAAQYAKKPEMIANKVYANRMGNGSEESGDGFKFRGRGLIQITGFNNYRDCSQEVFEDDRLIEEPDLVLEDNYAIVTACWFWRKLKLNALADAEDLKTMTKRINGGTIGLDDRIERYNHALDVLNA